MCKDRIETVAKSVKGVNSALWNMNTKKLDIEFNSMETSSETIQKAIAKAGHDTEKFKADDKIYANLPECCKYRTE
jgi:Cu(I)/Ag(I) efflux system membrane fusion protein